MDLSLLPHLSERALREEAERRGISTEGLDRSALVDAIRGDAARAVTVPPASSLAIAATEPDAPRDRSVSTASALIGRVVRLAQAALGRDEPPATRAHEEAAGEPIRTRSMAKVLESQGHLERALTIVRELASKSASDEGLRVWGSALEERIRERSIRELAGTRLAAGEHAFVAVLRGAEGARGAAWRVSDAGLSRARALLANEGALTLRVIRVRAHADRSVESRTEDRRPVERSGYARIDAPEDAKLVVSIGLWDGERFASIAHDAG